VGLSGGHWVGSAGKDLRRLGHLRLEELSEEHGHSLSLADVDLAKAGLTIRNTPLTGPNRNRIAAPLTGNQMSVYQTVDLTTSAVNIDAGGESGGIDFCF
jgi:hypothetical protein